MIEDTEAYRHWRDFVRYSRGDEANEAGIDYILRQIDDGWMFRPGEVDPVEHLGDYANIGLAQPLRRFLRQLDELVAGNAVLAGRMAELREQILIIELDLDGFAAGNRRFPDGSHLVQIDSGLFTTIFEVVQVFVGESMPDPEPPPGQHRREAAVVLELMLAEYRLLRRNASPKASRPTPAQGEATGELTQAANVFVLAHEVAHILLRHTGAHDDRRGQSDETVADVLALYMLAGAYSASAVIGRAQAYGRLLGARLLFSCIELFEQATFVTLGRTHPPAAERWAVVRAAAEQLFGPTIPDGVDHLWRPMQHLLDFATSGAVPLAEVAAVFEAATAQDRFIGDVDAAVATELIRLFRLTNESVDDSGLRAEGAALAARVATADRGGLSWRTLFDLQRVRRAGPADERASIVAVAGRLMRGVNE